MSKSKKLKKALKIVLNVLTYAFIALCLLAVIFTITGKRSEDGAIEIFGYQMRVVVSDSMEAYEGVDTSGYDIGSIPVRSMVFVKSVPEEGRNEWYASLREGDVLTFRYVYGAEQYTITHRISKITEKPTGGYIIELKGDNKASEDSDTLEQTIDTSNTGSPNYVLGKVVGQSRFLGFIVTAVSSTVGLVCIVIVPCVIIIIFEIMRIVGILTKDKKTKAKDEKKQMSEEIELLKKQLSELKAQDGQQDEQVDKE